MAAGAAERPHLPSQTVPPTGGKVFKHINLWGHSHLNHHKVSWLSFQWDYEELPSNTGKQYAWKHKERRHG